MSSRFMILVVCLTISSIAGALHAQNQLAPHQRICIIGNTTADRMQHDGWLETYLHALYPNHDFVLRNLGYAADEVQSRPRAENFGDANQWLTKCRADVVLCFFGYNEALRGTAGLPKFEQELSALIDDMQTQKYNGQSPPQLVFCSPIAHENLHDPNLPDGTANNQNLALYTGAMRNICQQKNIPFIDLFAFTQQEYQQHPQQRWTMNGIHLTTEGNRLVAREIISKWIGTTRFPDDRQLEKLRSAVLDKNYFWFSRYRVVDEYNVFGGRSKLEWFGQSNGDVMMREMEIFDVLTANRDQRIWALAKGQEFEINDNNLPPEIPVKPNSNAYPYLDPVEAISKMTVHEGLSVNLFASEKQFPRFVNPVQISFDSDSRLWVSVWESYPHWNPTQQRKDAIVILPDEDRDGSADQCIVFADGLNSVTGFEFWGGGVLVAALPEIWFLKDTDGDDVADVKIRMLQGMSSADTHHSANAMLIGPDGWLYFSRGVFNVANFETPTKTYRSTQTGVHRFNPRTFEVDFHFPIGPNPHGDSFDRWGYQFANDGTTGTGSYINIGKGVPNKEWFVKRVRPVPANGILSSSHFPPEMDGNFLIANVIGFLGILQLKTTYNGADILGHEVEPLIYSDDPNFRPSDMEIGGDGALYIADWHNSLIGHMQHNMRDPHRDHTHGRIYRMTAEGRELVTPPKMKGKPIDQVCQNFFARENATRYRARLELSGRLTADVVEQVGQFAASLNPQLDSAERDESQALLECLWVFEEHRVANLQLLKTVFQAAEPRVRAAAIRTLGHWHGRVTDWEPVLLSAARDDSALVRAEAVKAAVDLGGSTATRVYLEVAIQPLDPELDAVLKFAEKKLKIKQQVGRLLVSDNKIDDAVSQYVLAHGSAEELLKLKPSEAVQRAILARSDASQEQLSAALDRLAADTGTERLKLLLELVAAASDRGSNVKNLGRLLIAQPAADLKAVHNEFESLATDGATPAIKHLGYAAWIAAVGPNDAFLAATQSENRLRDFLEAVPSVDPDVRSLLFEKIHPLIFDLPANLKTDNNFTSRNNGVTASYYTPYSPSTEIDALTTRQPELESVISKFRLFYPEYAKHDSYSNLFRSSIQIEQSGTYTFLVASDDGSRLYVDGKLVVDNDGDHGYREKSGTIDLGIGFHPMTLVYFNSGGGEGLNVYWRGPGIDDKQPIPPQRLFLLHDESIPNLAIAAMATIPDRESEKFSTLARVMATGKHRAAAISALSTLPHQNWPANDVKPVIDNIVSYLSELTAESRTGPPAVEAMKLTRELGRSMTESNRAELEKRLNNLEVRVIAIGTVPHRMIFDKELIAIEAAQPVEFRFSNIDSMPHNFCITIPGALAEMGELAEQTGTEPDAIERHYIPASEKILLGSHLLQPGQDQALFFEAPATPGVYPFVCTYPGHWRRMFGALYVVENFQHYSADPEKYLAAHPLEIKDELLQLNTRGQEWKYEDLAADVQSASARSYEVGKAAFAAANCVACHRFNNEGTEFGPDLAKLDDQKRTMEYLLRSMIEPSKDIEEKYSSTMFLLFDGTTVTGMVLEENDNEVKIVIDPLAKDAATIIPQDDIDDRKKLELSPMPLGMLDKLSREEIIDLIAYVYSRGDQHDPIFGTEHHHH